MRRNARGFSLIELMIALALTTLIIAGLTQMVLTAGHSQAASARISVAQGGVRAAVEFLTRDIMSAAAGASTGVIWNGASLTGLPNQLLAVNVIDSATGPDELRLILVDGSRRGQLAQAYVPASSLVTVGPCALPSTLGAGIIQVSNLDAAVLLRATATGSDGNACPTLTVVPSGVGMPVPAYQPGSWAFQSRIVTYSVTTTTVVGSNPVLTYPVLNLDADGPEPGVAEPLAEGIEDFQVALGFDFNGDGVVNPVESASGGADEWVFNVAGEAMPATLLGLRTVRITLVSRPTTADVGARGLRPAAENRAAAISPDAFPRRVLRTEISVRNFNL